MSMQESQNTNGGSLKYNVIYKFMDNIMYSLMKARDMIMYHPFLKSIFIIGMVCLACNFIYIAGKYTGEFIATMMK